MTIAVGDHAPDFTLPAHTGEPITLSDLRGDKAVVLMFYPFAFSSICSGELCSIRDQLRDFSNDRVTTLAVSTDAVPALRAFARQEEFEFPLLADFWPHGAVAKAYGVFHEAAGAAERGTFVIDRDGVVQYAVHNGLGDARDDGAYLEALRHIGAA